MEKKIRKGRKYLQDRKHEDGRGAMTDECNINTRKRNMKNRRKMEQETREVRIWKDKKQR